MRPLTSYLSRLPVATQRRIPFLLLFMWWVELVVVGVRQGSSGRLSFRFLSIFFPPAL